MATQYEFVVGDTKLYQFAASIDSVPWDFSTLPQAAVTFFLHAPDTAGAIVYSLPATVTSTASYTDNPSHLTSPGMWGRSWRVVKGNITLTTPVFWFNVQLAP